jgi:hypothetical protein
MPDALPTFDRVWSPVETARVVDLDRGLATAVAPEQRVRAARSSVARILRVHDGPWRPAPEPGIGLLVIDGLVLARVGWEHRIAAEVLGAGDILRPAEPDDLDPSLPLEEAWHVLRPVRLAVLDYAWAARLAPWPQVTAALAQRMMARTRRATELMAIDRLRRLDLRVWLVLWRLADRFGRVRRDGVHVDVPLTHRQLAELAGARRPSVSAAVSRLASAGSVRQVADGWLLDGPPPVEKHECATVTVLPSAA